MKFYQNEDYIYTIANLIESYLPRQVISLIDHDMIDETNIKYTQGYLTQRFLIQSLKTSN